MITHLTDTNVFSEIIKVIESIGKFVNSFERSLA